MPTPTSTVEISNIAPALRSDLRFSLQKYGDESYYLIEDDKNSRFYRIGIAEYTFISLLDGTTAIREAMAHTASLLGDKAFTERDAICICKWLVECDLAQTEASTETTRLADAFRKVSRRKLLERSNPLLFRLPLLRPDRALTATEKWLGWWISWPATILWLATVSFAGHQLLTHWQGIKAQSLPTFSPQNLLWMSLVWCCLKFFHELAHGLACKRFGGHVREAGLMFILFAPIPYVDVTSAWKIPSKWKRIFISAAGMYIELFLAAIAALVWIHTDAGAMHQQAYNVMLTGSLITLFFNANPLMRFDGYYMLSDWLEIPNLYAAGQQSISYFARRYLLDIKLRPQRLPGRRQLIVNVYGTLAFAWRILVVMGLMITASTLFHGAGVVLALLGAALWLGLPAVRLIKYLLHGNQTERPSVSRFLMSASAISAGVVLLALIPEPGGVRAPGIVQFDPLHVVRAPHAGFLAEVEVASGARVAAEQKMLRVVNPELENEVAKLRLESEESIHRERIFRKDGNIAAIQIEAELRSSLDKRISEISQQLQQSVIRAPANGQIMTREVEALPGTYVDEGEELLSIGSEGQKRVEVSIAQLDLSNFEAMLGSTVHVAFTTPGQPRLRSRLSGVDPRASHKLLDPALSATHGGPLTVRKSDDEATDEAEQWELVEPRFKGKVALTPKQSCDLKAGQRTTVRLQTSRGTLIACLYRNVRDWVEGKLERLRSQ